MHRSVLDWVGDQIVALGLREMAPVLEVGSCDVNGSVCVLFNTSGYTGVDIVKGPGVDQIVLPAKLPFVDDHFAVVVSTEMLEHAEFPAAVLGEMWRVLKPGGVLLLTTRSEGFARHNPPDYWRFSGWQMHDLLHWTGFVHETVVKDPQAAGVFAVAYKGRASQLT
jgi:SAM-dependent methyltransferase